MSSTRTRPPGTPPPQCRYGSSAALRATGLKPALVADRCSVLADAAHRELIWCVQARSHQPSRNFDNGLAELAAELRGSCEDRLIPLDLFKQRKNKAAVLSVEMVERLKKAMWSRDAFFTRCDRGNSFLRPRTPQIYTVGDFMEFAAHCAYLDLSDYLQASCLNPELNFGDPWYFNDLARALAASAERWAQDRAGDVAKTSVCDSLAEAIRYARETGSVVLFTMPSGTGKNFQARAYCARWPGRARYVQVPDGNDRRTFFAAFASACGGPDGSAWKAQQLQERIKAIAQQSGLVTILDDGLQMLPTRERETVPDRIDWPVTALAERNVPAVILTQASFDVRLLAIQERSTWSASSFLERVVRWEPPAGLEKKEIEAVARAMSPSAEGKDLAAMAHITLTARGGSLHFLEQLRRNISFVAGQAAVTAEHVRAGIGRFSIPQANALATATAAAQKKAARKFIRTPPPLAARETPAPPPRTSRETAARAGEKPARQTVPEGFAGTSAE